MVCILHNLLLFLLVCIAGLRPAFAEPKPFQELLSREEYETLVRDLALKVNLFKEAWENDPKAEFFGGTSRDFMYWVKGQFKAAKSKDEAQQIATQLRSRKLIDVKEFIINESDVDVLTNERMFLDSDRYNVKKIDMIRPDRIDPNSTAGRDEVRQGYIPVEKIRLGRNGIVKPTVFGDGANEIYTGKVTVHFSPREEFDSTYFARNKINHPILLSLRYLRLLAANHFYQHGSGFPDTKQLFDIDPESEKEVRKVLKEISQPDVLRPYFSQEKFKKWLTETVLKAFRAYTSPTAAKELFDHFGINELPSIYADFPKYNEYVFSKYRKPSEIDAHFREFGTTAGSVFLDMSKAIPDGKLFHGTSSALNYRAILFQGVLPSRGGSAGNGVYSVARGNVEDAVRWASSADRVVELTIRGNSKIVDVENGPGKVLWDAYKTKYPAGDHDTFADYFGVDIIKYPYNFPALVIKNADVISDRRGYALKLMPFSKIWDLASQVTSLRELEELFNIVRQNGLFPAELKMLIEHIEEKATDEQVKRAVIIARKIIEREKVTETLTAPVVSAVLRLLGEHQSEMKVFVTEVLRPHVLRSGNVNTPFVSELLSHNNPIIDAYLTDLVLRDKIDKFPESEVRQWAKILTERAKNEDYATAFTLDGKNPANYAKRFAVTTLVLPGYWTPEQKPSTLLMFNELKKDEIAAEAMAGILGNERVRKEIDIVVWSRELMKQFPSNNFIRQQVVGSLFEHTDLKKQSMFSDLLLEIIEGAVSAKNFGEALPGRVLGHPLHIIRQELSNAENHVIPGIDRVIDKLIEYEQVDSIFLKEWKNHPRFEIWKKAVSMPNPFARDEYLKDSRRVAPVRLLHRCLYPFKRLLGLD